MFTLRHRPTDPEYEVLAFPTRVDPTDRPSQWPSSWKLLVGLPSSMNQVGKIFEPWPRHATANPIHEPRKTVDSVLIVLIVVDSVFIVCL